MRKLRGFSADSTVLRGVSTLGFIALMTSASACTAHDGVKQTGVGYLCAVDSTKMIAPIMSEDQVCALFKAKIDDALQQKTVTVDSASKVLPEKWMKLEVRFSMPATASATFVQSTNGKETVHPEIAVDVMDKAMGPKDVDMLASAAAKYLAENQKR